MADKKKSIRLGNKIIKCRQNVYYRFKENAKKQRLSQVAYLEKLMAEDETTVIPRALTEHFGALDNLMTKYKNPLFSEVFTYLRPIFLRAIRLEKGKQTEFLKRFINQLEKELDSMVTDSNKKGEDKV